MTHGEPHVFVTQGDLTKIACDAWMLPTDRQLSVKAHWLESEKTLQERLGQFDSAEFLSGSRLAAALPDGGALDPSIVVGAVPFKGIVGAEGIEEAMASIREFVAVGAEVTQRRLRIGSPPGRRGYPLLALPAFGVEGGGGHAIRGELLESMWQTAKEESMRHGVDIAVVVRDPAMFGLLQRLRKKDVRASWPNISQEALVTLETLARYAQSGRLVPFMGSGVSVSAGGPSWQELLSALAEQAGATEDMVKSLLSGGHSPLDQASILRLLYMERFPDHPDGDGGFAKTVATNVTLERYGLTPLLLASLKTDQSITLNYDSVFESASRDVGLERTVIPDTGGDGSQPPVESGAWLLKLHGSADRPESIVLTRDDYLGYSTQRDALSAIVKANLITHHLLLVGFGFSDDHFHQILHDVTRALPGRGTQKLGTAISVGVDEFTERLWGQRLELMTLTSQDKAHAGRELEILLDALLALAGDEHQYLLQDGFESGLDEAELKLKARLVGLHQEVSESEQKTAAWASVMRLLQSLGGEV